MGKLILNSFHFLCLTCTIAISAYCAYKFYLNEDNSVVEFNKFNGNENNIYPSLSLFYYDFLLTPFFALTSWYNLSESVPSLPALWLQKHAHGCRLPRASPCIAPPPRRHLSSVLRRKLEAESYIRLRALGGWSARATRSIDRASETLTDDRSTYSLSLSLCL